MPTLVDFAKPWNLRFLLIFVKQRCQVYSLVLSSYRIATTPIPQSFNISFACKSLRSQNPSNICFYLLVPGLPFSSLLTTLDLFSRKKIFFSKFEKNQLTVTSNPFYLHGNADSGQFSKNAKFAIFAYFRKTALSSVFIGAIQLPNSGSLSNPRSFDISFVDKVLRSQNPSNICFCHSGTGIPFFITLDYCWPV